MAMLANEILSEFGMVGWPKTSGSRCFHIYVRWAPKHDFTDVRCGRSGASSRDGAPPAGPLHLEMVEGGAWDAGFSLITTKTLATERWLPHIQCDPPRTPEIGARHMG